MKLSEIFPALTVPNIEITSLAFSVDKVEKGSLFFCLSGKSADGHDFLEAAKERGAAAAVVEKDVFIHNIHLLKVENSRLALAEASKRFYGGACDRMTMAAVTGTNGKTTTAHMLAAILSAAGKNCGLIGTNGIRYGEVELPSALTTPDPPELHRTFAEMEKAGVTHVAMEASAHALALGKTAGITFAAAGFTNLTQDHLDYFGTMEEYTKAKLRLFDRAAARAACINADDPLGQRMIAEAALPVLSYGRGENCGIRILRAVPAPGGSAVTLVCGGEKLDFLLPMAGDYNVSNAACAAGMAVLLGAEPSAVAEGLSHMGRVNGRFETYDFFGVTVIIDFAHTDDGLARLLDSVRRRGRGRVITVFGCGGDRDRSKRPLMGRAASERSEITIVTSDNPRSEEPSAIISDIVRGIKGRENVDYILEPCRERAIGLALRLATKGDSVVIAGKGAENYIEVKGRRYRYSDREFLLELMKQRGARQ